MDLYMALLVVMLLVGIFGVLGVLMRRLNVWHQETHAHVQQILSAAEHRLGTQVHDGLHSIGDILTAVIDELPKIPISVVEKVEALIQPVYLPRIESESVAPVVPPEPEPVVPPVAVLRTPRHPATIVLMDANRQTVHFEGQIDSRRIRPIVKHEGKQYSCCDKDLVLNRYTYRQNER